MANPNARRFAITRSIAQRKKSAANGNPPKRAAFQHAANMDVQNAAPTPQPIHIDLQSATLCEGSTSSGHAFVTFHEVGLPIIMGFGRHAEALKRDRLAKGMAVRNRGLLKIVALHAGDLLLDERGASWRQAA